MDSKMLRDRFKGGISPILLEFSSSLESDKGMILEDVWGSEVHVLMLMKQGIISRGDAKKIIESLKKAEKNFMNGKFKLSEELEDIHLNVENYVIKNSGLDYGGRMHTARSRNDQVLTDTKIRLRNEILEIEELVIEFQKTLLILAEKYADAVMPGYTHMQHAQPMTFGFWISSYVSMLIRDLERLKNAYKSVNLCPLGACALAGTSFHIDRKFTSRLLGFDGVHEHSLDAVGSRDFVAETLAVMAILMSNLSRFAEDLIIWSSYEFGFIEFSDSFSTGSSIMPQKKNPDVAELVRGKSGRIYGSLIQILTVLKGLPSGYNRDLQEDRELLWDSIHVLKSSLRVLNEGLRDMKINKERMEEMANSNFSTATELANFLVRDKDLSFRKAYEIVAAIVKELIRKKKDFRDVENVRKILKKFTIEISAKELGNVLDPKKVVAKNRSMGGTSPREVRRMLRSFKNVIKVRNGDLRKRRDRIRSAQRLTEEMIKEL
ncbi:MAG: argininosuccinate lyase [Candidatus Altiarchaeales archaeon]|nr:MAG: argininosuccinate lyase [Candidatus Altiarchaeales archaeon]HDI72598.1 argininosuccinate lyase [Candidatus Altiarchaeales archaeon]